MHDAVLDSPFGQLGRCDAVEFFPGRQKARVGHLERLEDFLGGITIEPAPAGDPDNFSQQKEIDELKTLVNNLIANQTAQANK